MTEGMSDLVGLFDALYSRLLLRDVFGKILPGSVVILVVAASLHSATAATNYLQSMPFWFWLLFLGAAWVVAFAVQAFGEATGLIRWHAKKLSYEEFFAKRYQFDNRVGSRERQQLERLAVIKEACGNSYLALAIAGLTLLIGGFVDAEAGAQYCELLKKSWHVALLVVGLVLFLARMHFVHVERYHIYMSTILKECELLKAVEKSSN